MEFNNFKNWVQAHNGLIFQKDSFERIEEAFNFFEEYGTIELDARIFNRLHPKSKQTKFGITYTPKNIRQEIIYTIFKKLKKQERKIIDLTFCDPCSGSGTFAIDVALELTKYGIDLYFIFNNNIYISDKDEVSLLLSMSNIYLFLKRNDINVFDIRLNASLVDFFIDNKKYDVFITNPPYVKLQNITITEREYLKTKFKEVFSGALGTAPLFLFHMLNRLNQNGLVGVITQNNFFTSIAAKKIRYHISKHLYQINTFGSNHIFEDVSAYTCLLFLSKEEQLTFNYVKDSIFCEMKNDILDPEKWRLGTPSQLFFLRKTESSGIRLGDLCDIFVGVATLKDKAFTVFNENGQWVSQSPSGQKLIIESGVIKPLIKISELNSDVDIENNSRGIIFPYEIEENKFRPFTEEKFQDIYPQTYLALKLWQNELKLRSSFKKGGVWYEWGRTQSMKSIKDKLLTKTFNNFPQFMLDTTDSLFSNGYALKPKGVSLSFIQKILNSQFFWKYAKLTSFEIEGGYQCYQKNFIENFTIPESLIALEEEVINMKYLSSTFFYKHYELL